MIFGFDIKMISQIYHGWKQFASPGLKISIDLINFRMNHRFMDLDTFIRMKFHLFLILIPGIFVSCQQDPVVMKPLDLHDSGIPITIMAPDSADVQVRDYSFMRDITIRSGADFFIQIFEYQAPRLDAAGEKLSQLSAVRAEPTFQEVVREDDQGFIFSRQLDSLQLDYDFRYIRILGDKELIFQTGLVGTFSLEAVQRMYKAVK
jgi:hypothetical protein